MKYYTNITGTDGFGAQYQRIIYNYIDAKNNNLEFLYTPFKCIEHNYDNNPNFIDEIENLINLKNNIKNYCNNSNVNVLMYNYGKFENNIDNNINSNHMKFIKNCFWENKNKNVFNNNKINIAVHIRRGDVSDIINKERYLPDKYYLNIINIIINKYKDKQLLFHIYSEGKIEDFEIYKNADTKLHINEDICKTFIQLVAADILVMSKSSFSYVAALLSDGEVYYKKFWHKPRKGWNVYH